VALKLPAFEQANTDSGEARFNLSCAGHLT
jgi:hypothetical protein